MTAMPLPAAPVAHPPAPAVVASDLLGPLLAPPDACYTFDAGLYGFEACRRFVLVPAGRPALYWLQSAEEPGLVFLLADPGHFFAHHDVDVPGAEIDALAGPGAHAADCTALVIVTLGEQRGAATANLQAPVVLHGPSRAGRQVVLDDGHQRVRVPLAIA